LTCVAFDGWRRVEGRWCGVMAPRQVRSAAFTRATPRITPPQGGAAPRQLCTRRRGCGQQQQPGHARCSQICRPQLLLSMLVCCCVAVCTWACPPGTARLCTAHAAARSAHNLAAGTHLILVLQHLCRVCHGSYQVLCSGVRPQPEGGGRKRGRLRRKKRKLLLLSGHVQCADSGGLPATLQLQSITPHWASPHKQCSMSRTRACAF
jgi:hypothetical protein